MTTIRGQNNGSIFKLQGFDAVNWHSTVDETSGSGSFTNYVDKILVFFDHLPPALAFLTKSGNFWTNYLPRLVNVVCERPLQSHLLIMLWMGKRVILEI